MTVQREKVGTITMTIVGRNGKKGGIGLKRDPIKSFKEKYTKRFQITDFFPLLFWTKCEKCGNEFRGEGMYEAIVWAFPFSKDIYKHGCKECFPTKEEFREFLVENGYVEKKYLLDYDRS